MLARRLAAAALFGLSVAALGAAPKPPAPAPAAPAKPAPPATISGKISGPDGKPIAGATVRAIPMPPKPEAAMRAQRPDAPKPVVVKSDAQGGFKLEGLPRGTQALRAEAPGLAPAFASDVPAGASLNLRLKPGFTVVGRVLDLTTQKPLAGATVTALERDAARFGRDAAHTTTTGDDGTFKITDCAQGVVVVEAIAPAKARARLDRVPSRAPAPGEEPDPQVNTLYLAPGGRLAGKVVGSDAKPLADAIVTAAPTDGNLMTMFRESRNAAQRTDANGKFSFDGLPAGSKYTVRATKEGLASDDDGPLPVDAGTDRGDLELKLESGASLTFRLVTAEDVPVNDVDVRLASQGGARRRGGFGGTDVDRDKITPQGDGKFLVRALDAGTFDLTLSPPDYADVTKEGLKLRGGETLDLGTLRVRESKSIAGRITDNQGQPVAGAVVFALWLDGATSHVREVRSNAEGRFRLAGLSDLPVRNLSVRADGFATATKDGATPGDTAVDFVLQRNGSIVGRVQLSAGGVPAAFRVQAHPEAKEGQERAGFRIMIGNRPDEDKVFTDPSGSFRLDGVEPGTVTITVLSDGKAPARKTGLVVASDGVADAGTLTLTDGRTLRGRVIAAKDEAPIAGATISLSQPQGFMMAMGRDNAAAAAITGVDGRFEIAGLEAKTYSVDAGQIDYSPNSGRVEIPAEGAVDELTIKLSRGGIITGAVKDAQKQPVPNAQIILTNPGRGSGPQTVSSGADGRYTFEKIPPGEYIVMRAPSGGGPMMIFGGMKQVAVREGETTTFDIDEAAKINLSGRVTKAGLPVANAMLSFWVDDGSEMGGEMKVSRTDGDGRYQVGLDHAGSYSVAITTGMRMFVAGRRSKITVPDDPTPVVDIPVKGAEVSGHVTNSEGKPVSGAMVSVRAKDGTAPAGDSRYGGPTSDVTDPDGSYVVDNLDPGDYAVTVAAAGYRNAEGSSVKIEGDGDTRIVDVRLEKGRTVRGHVFDANGNGIAGAMVMAAPSGAVPSGNDALPANTDVNGAFVVTAPADGPIDLTAVAAGFPPARVTGIIPEDGGDLALRAPRPGRIKVTVAGADGKPIAGARVGCRPVPTFLGSDYLSFVNASPPTGADGTATIASLGPGAYELVVSRDQKRSTRSVTISEGAEAVETVTLP